FKPVKIRDRGDCGNVELPDGAHQYAGRDLERRAFGRRDPTAPAQSIVVPRGPIDGAAEPDVLLEAELFHAAVDIGEHLALLREIARPSGIDGEGIGIEMACRIDLRTGIAVIVPGAANAGVFLIESERY